MLNSSFFTPIYNKYMAGISKVEMLSSRKFHLLEALLRVFFDSRSANRVPKRLKQIAFNTGSMAKFSDLFRSIIESISLTGDIYIAYESFRSVLSFVFTLLFAQMRRNTVPKRLKFSYRSARGFESRRDQFCTVCMYGIWNYLANQSTWRNK